MHTYRNMYFEIAPFALIFCFNCNSVPIRDKLTFSNKTYGFRSIATYHNTLATYHNIEKIGEK